MFSLLHLLYIMFPIILIGSKLGKKRLVGPLENHNRDILLDNKFSYTFSFSIVKGKLSIAAEKL